MTPAGPRVYLTGATGFIGGALARRLAERGFRLRCLVRPSSDTRGLQALGAELVTGDVANPADHDRGLRDASLAYHLAGIYDLGPIDAAELRRVNVEGTRAFLEAAARAATPRTVHISTTAALGPVAEGVGDETAIHSGACRTVYERTKLDAHRLAVRAQQAGAPLIIACPAFVYGPADEGPPGRLIRDLLRRRLPGLLTDPAWFSYVHVDDVALGLERLADAGHTGETYVFAGEPMSVNDFAGRVAALAGVPVPRLRLPVPLARLTGALLDGVTRLTGARFSFSRESVDAASSGRWVYSWDKAKRELGWEPRPVSEGLPPTVEWFAEQVGGVSA